MDIDLAAFRLRALASLTSGGGSSPLAGGSSSGDFMDILQNARSALSGGGSLSGSGSLAGGQFDRASSVLAQLEASNANFLQRYKARVAEIGDESEVLNRLRTRMGELGEASNSLQDLAATGSDTEIKQALRGFIERYNAWDSEFDPYFENGALLDDNQAGEVARFSLRREVGSIFHGAGNGGFELGLTDMGLKFSPDGQLTLDEAAFDAALAQNRQAALQTLDNMATAFGNTADLLGSEGHLLDRRIDNADRAVAWASENQAAVDQEFGPGAVSTRLGS